MHAYQFPPRLPTGVTNPGQDLRLLGEAAEIYHRPIEGYVRLGTESIFVRVEPFMPGADRPVQGYIVLAEGPPPFGSPQYTGKKWRAATRGIDRVLGA